MLSWCDILYLPQVLPLLTLYQYFTTSVCRDLQRTVDGRILRVRALTELGFFSEAVVILQRLLNGDKLPLTTTSLFRNTEGRPFNVRFTTAKPLLDNNNLKVGHSRGKPSMTYSHQLYCALPSGKCLSSVHM